MNGTIKITDAVYVVRDLPEPQSVGCSDNYDSIEEFLTAQRKVKEWYKQTKPVKVSNVETEIWNDDLLVWFDGALIIDNAQSCEYHIEDQEAIITKLK